MSRTDVWINDIRSAYKKWEGSKNTGDYEIYAMACAAYLCSKEFESTGEHWFCGSSQTLSFTISSLIMFSFTLTEGSDDPASIRYRSYENKFTTILSNCRKCAITYQCSDGELMHELLDRAGIPESRVLLFFKELHRKDRLRLATQLSINKNSLPVLTEILWSHACMTSSSFVSGQLVDTRLLTGGSSAMKELACCPGFILLSFIHIYELKSAAMRKVLKPENLQEYIDAWKRNPAKFAKMFSYGLKRNVQAEHWADLAWYTAASLLRFFSNDPVVYQAIIQMCSSEMQTARGLPKYGAHLLVLQILKTEETKLKKILSEDDLERILDYTTSFCSLKYGLIDPGAPEAAQLSGQYKGLSAGVIIEWSRLYFSRNPPPSTSKVAKRLGFLLELSTDAFKSRAEYENVGLLSMKTASFYTDPSLVDLVLNVHGPRIAQQFVDFKSNWIFKLWNYQLRTNIWSFLWELVLNNPDFGIKSVFSDNSSGFAIGVLQGSKNVALMYKLPKKSQKSQPVSPQQDGCSKCESIIKQLLEALTDTGENGKLVPILLDKYVLRSLLLLSVSGNKSLSLAAEEFIRQALDEDTREAYVHRLVKEHTDLMFTAMNSILGDAAPANVDWLAVMPGLIRLALTVLDQLYSTYDGVELTGNKPLFKLLRHFWEKSWESVANIIKSIRSWAQDYAASHVKLVLIAALEFSQGLLSKIRLLDADFGIEFPDEQNWGALLAEPAISCINGMGDMLQLAIPELLAMAVSIIVDILGLMRSFKAAIPESLLSLLEGLATKRLNSRLSKDQLRELLTAANLGEDEINEMIELRKSKTTFATQIQSKLGSTSSPTTRTNQHQQLSIGDFFKTSGGQRPPAPQRPIVGNHIVPQAPQQLSGINLIRAQLSKRDLHQGSGGSTAGKPKPLATNAASASVIYPERPPGFNKPSKPQSTSGNVSDDDDDDDDEISALHSLGAQQKREAAAAKLREAYEQTKNKKPATHIIAETNTLTQQRLLQKQKEQEKRAMKARLAVQPTELHRQILSWDYYAKLPPFKANISVPNKFENATQYIDIMAPLLYLEAWEQIQNTKDEISKYHPSPFFLVFGKKVKVDGFSDVYVSVSKSMFAEAGLTEGDLLLLGNDNSNPTLPVMPSSSMPHCLARIKEASIRNQKKSSKTQYVDFQIRLSENASFLNALYNGSSVVGLNLGGIRTVEREYTALMALPYYDLLSPILEARPTISQDHANQISRLQEKMGLNTSQAVAVSRALTGQGFNLIQGPPGTGKTKTILGIVGAFFTANSLVSNVQDHGVNMSKRILICAPSNAAVDEIVLRLKKGVTDATGKHQNLQILRLGRLDAISEEVRDVSLDSLMAKVLNNSAEPVDEQLRRDHTSLVIQRNEVKEKLHNHEDRLSPDVVRSLTDRLKELGKEIREKNYALDMQRDRLEQARKQKDIRARQQQNDILQKTQVVCTTLSASAHPLLAGLGVSFDTVIIDEAAQCIELSALIPLKYGCKHCIMVGDPNQLPPTVISQEASRLKYEQSMFVRMFNQYKSVNGAISMLDTQFRMHPEISKFPSAQFYLGKLKDADNLAIELTRPWHSKYRALGPYTFFEVKGKHENHGRSLKNKAEADAVLALVNFVIRNFPEVKNIGVISPYREQVKHIEQSFANSREKLPQSLVTFNSVDGFQGQEKDIIIMSCVRASSAKTNNVGFLSDVRRMNVAITRAKTSLWVLGHPESLESNTVWKSLLTDARERDLFVAQQPSGSIIDSIKHFDRNSAPKMLFSRDNADKKSTNLSDKPKYEESKRETRKRRNSSPSVSIDDNAKKVPFDSTNYMDMNGHGQSREGLIDEVRGRESSVNHGGIEVTDEIVEHSIQNNIQPNTNITISQNNGKPNYPISRDKRKLGRKPKSSIFIHRRGKR